MSNIEANTETRAKNGGERIDEALLSSAVLENVIDPTLVIGEDGIIVYFNRAACEAFGVEVEAAIGSNVSMFMAEEAHAMNHGLYMSRYKETGVKKMIGRNRTVKAKRADGTTWDASLSISEVTLDSKNYFVGSLRDVTESMTRERLFSSVIDEAIDAIFTIDDRGIITLVNRSACQMFGFKEDELIGHNVSILMPDPHRSNHDKYIQAHMKTGMKKMIGTDRTVTAQRKDGSQFQCRLGLSKLENGTGKGASFVGLLHDLTHELAAREADARAELANKMRKQKALFLASMSHEIRTPLNGIFGMLELLRSTELDEVQTEWLATCARSAQSLTTILDDILLFSRADGGGIKLERLSFNVRDTIEDSITVLASQTNDKAVDLVYTVSRSVPERMIGDPTRLRQIMLIFLSNALKFTSVGHVALEVSIDGIEDDSDESDDDEAYDVNRHDNNDDGKDGKLALKIEVSDTGIGMSKKQIKKLFQPFTQADASTTRQYGGTGLGLSIAQKLVSLMDGEIKVESRPGRGSTFTFTAMLEVDPDCAAVSDLHDAIPENDFELLQGTHILSIDDNAVNTDYLVNLLKLVGCDVTGARSGVDGIELCKMAALREDPYEIVLCDYAMPGMSGLEVAEIISSSQTISSTNVRIVMLGSIDVHRKIAVSPHVHGFTTKPIRRHPLIRMIVEQLKIKRGILVAPKTKGPIALRERSLQPAPPTPTTSSESLDSMVTSSPNDAASNNDTKDTDDAKDTDDTKDTDDIAVETPPQNLRAQRPNPLNILYVEDNLINQKVIVSILSKWKCNVTTALNGIAGFEERVSHRGKKAFDLILCDLHMPSCDGFQCVKMIREWEKKNNAPASVICAVTADADADTQEHCLSPEGGFNEFLAKPLRKNALRDAIVQMCGDGRLVEDGTVATPRVPKDSTSKAQTRPSSGGTHVLVVDDAPTMRLLLNKFLAGMGCLVSEASSGEAAVELVRTSFADSSNPDPIEMIFCDIRMPPGIDGLETARRIKRINGTANVPIVGMTADDVSNAFLEEARSAGMASLLSKPLGKSQLASFLAEYTGTVFVPGETAAKPAEGEIFDKKKALDTCSGDKEFLKTLLNDMANDLIARKETLSLSVQRKDCARVAEIAHNIKGMAAICSFKRLAAAACECQKSASGSDYYEVRTQSQKVIDEITQAVKIAQGFDPASA